MSRFTEAVRSNTNYYKSFELNHLNSYGLYDFSIKNTLNRMTAFNVQTDCVLSVQLANANESFQSSM